MGVRLLGHAGSRQRELVLADGRASSRAGLRSSHTAGRSSVGRAVWRGVSGIPADDRALPAPGTTTGHGVGRSTLPHPVIVDGESVTKDGCSGWVNGVPTDVMDAPTVSTGAQTASMDARTVSTDAPMAVTNAPIPARPIGAHCCAGRWPPGPSVPPSVASLSLGRTARVDPREGASPSWLIDGRRPCGAWVFALGVVLRPLP